MNHIIVVRGGELCLCMLESSAALYICLQGTQRQYIVVLAGRAAKPEQLTTSMLEELIPVNPRMLQTATPSVCEPMNRMTIPMLEYVIKQLILVGDPATALKFVESVIGYCKSHKASLTLVFLKQWRKSIKAAQEGAMATKELL